MFTLSDTYGGKVALAVLFPKAEVQALTEKVRQKPGKAVGSEFKQNSV